MKKITKVVSSCVLAGMLLLLLCACNNNNNQGSNQEPPAKAKLALLEATDQNKEKYEIVGQFVEDANAEKVLLITETGLNKFKIVSVVFDEIQQLLVDGTVLYTLDQPLNEKQGMMLTTVVPEGIPKIKVEIEDKDGNYHEYMITYNGQDGKTMLVEQDVAEE